MSIELSVANDALQVYPSTYLAKTGTYDIQYTDSLIDCTTGSYDINLPSAVGIAGKSFFIKNSGTGSIAVKCKTGGQTIDGLTELDLVLQYGMVGVMSDGANYKIIGSYIIPPGVHATISDSTTQTVGATNVAYPLTLDSNDDLTGITHDIIGTTVTISQASPAVVSWSSHPLYVGSCVQFSTDGTLPSPLVSGTRYYVISAGYGANSFQIATSPGGTAINTTTSGSGSHKARATSRIVVPQRGNYIFALSSVLDTTNNAACLMDLWIRKNGTNIPGTNTQIGFQSNNIQQVLAVTLSLELIKDDCIEFMYHCSTTAARFLAVAAQAGPPAVPACPSTIICIWKSSR